MDNFYVYLHLKKGTNTPFYVGKGIGPRAWKNSGRSERWTRISKKYGHDVEILFDNLSEEQAFDLELNTILELKYFGYDLANHTIGGGGCAGYVWNQEQRERLSKSLKGKKRTQEQVERSSKARIGIKKSPEQIEKNRISHLGLKASEETKIKMSAAQKERHSKRQKPVYVFYSDLDYFIGTKIELSEKYNLDPKDLRTLFWSKPNKSAKGWRILGVRQLIILSLLNKEGET